MNDSKNKAITIIKNNSRGNFTIPCKELYPFQWNWDSAFCALGIYTYDSYRAVKEIDMLFKGQWENGMIPQIIFHKYDDSYYPGPQVWNSKTTPNTSCISQPPVLSTIIWFMMVLGLKDKQLLNNYFEKLMKYHKWYIENRDPYNTGLLSVFHPWESGRDNSPEWDDALNNIEINNELFIERKDDLLIKDEERPTNDDYNRYMQIVFKCEELHWDNKKIYDDGLFNVCDPGIQFIFIRACKDLYKIAIFLERKLETKLIERWIYYYSNNTKKLWNTNINSYCALNRKNNKLFTDISSGSMLFAYADVGNIKEKKYMIKHCENILNTTIYGFPSMNPNNKNFDRKKYWKGPIWCIMNFMISIGLANIGKVEYSKLIKKQTIDLIENNGFHEYYDPFTGEGYGGEDFSWTASIYLIFKNEVFM